VALALGYASRCADQVRLADTRRALDADHPACACKNRPRRFALPAVQAALGERFIRTARVHDRLRAPSAFAFYPKDGLLGFPSERGRVALLGAHQRAFLYRLVYVALRLSKRNGLLAHRVALPRGPRPHRRRRVAGPAEQRFLSDDIPHGEQPAELRAQLAVGSAAHGVLHCRRHQHALHHHGLPLSQVSDGELERLERRIRLVPALLPRMHTAVVDAGGAGLFLPVLHEERALPRREPVLSWAGRKRDDLLFEG